MEKVVTFFKNLTTIFYFKFLELKKAFLERSKFERLKFELELNFTATRYSSPPGSACQRRSIPPFNSHVLRRSTRHRRARVLQPVGPPLHRSATRPTRRAPFSHRQCADPPLLHTFAVALKSDVIASLSPLRWFSLKKVCKNRTTPHPPTSHPL
jgi:hypothetical protein